MNQQIDPKAADRIRKLLALANDGGATEAEASLAMEKAQELMADLNITLASVEASGGVGESRTQERNDKKLMYKWKQELLDTLAKVNFCLLDIVHKRNVKGERIAGGYNIIGRQSNIAAVKNMYEYLTSTIERLLVQEVGTDPRARFNRWSHTFRLGAAERLQERLTARYEELLKEQERKANEEKARQRHPSAASSSNALVVVLRDFASSEADLNEDLRRGVAPGTTSAERAKWDAEYAARRAKREAERAEQDRKKQEFIDQGIPADVAHYMAQGFTRERAEDLCKPAKPESPSARRRRERAEANSSYRYWKQYDKRNAHRHSEGFRRGQDRAETIGLDTQIPQNSARRIS